MKTFRLVVLFYAIFYVIRQPDIWAGLKSMRTSALIFFLCCIIPVIALGSTDPIFSLNRAQTFIVPFMYTFLSVSLLIYRYGQRYMLIRFSELVLLVYSIPVLSYLLFGGNFSGKSIYGISYESELVFASNHFGWSSAMLLISALFFWRTHNLRLLPKIAVIFLYLLAAYLVVVSANRTSMLAIALSLLVFFFRYKGVNLISKIILLTIPFAVFFYFRNQENSAVDFIIKRTQYQREVGGEGRLKRTEYLIEQFNRQPALWVSGAGIFDYSIFQQGDEGFGGYHNSYWELLFGLGIPLFLLFMRFMLFIPTLQFIRRISRFDFVFIPLALIPFFESNLTGGQFLFFPWFIYIFILNGKQQYYRHGVRNRPLTIEQANH